MTSPVAGLSSPGVTMSRWVFAIAGIYGILVLAPQYFMERTVGEQFPPPITHPENYYGFVGVALAWQVLFLMMARDPLRYRPAMIPAILEKVAFGGACLVLFLQGRLSPVILAAGSGDLLFGVLFAVCYWRTRAR